MKKKPKTLTVVLFGLLALLFFYKPELLSFLTSETAPSHDEEAAYTIYFPSDRFPETAEHIRIAVERGKSSICTIDRKGADENRKESLKGVPTKPNLDRDEWPMAMCAEGGAGADIMHISPSDNRGAGSWVSNQLEKYADGTKVRIVVK
ncbi:MULTISPECIES: NucA/NucB deoxyribonuclease domain-containing protein [Paenibacillus]|jgi:hypothetical protein|uniref:DNA-entry nuclease n=1 Tax=Paenibacillus oceani TaxID=2772510 RepID=A0A927C7M2_9BACL|nr:NucA/NucB deoxyribonuclease domain-containing protein [Paenibacillus oceani]MBD2861492.1 DNA-entry nuclease [Paenibacillus oceani]